MIGASTPPESIEPDRPTGSDTGSALDTGSTSDAGMAAVAASSEPDRPSFAHASEAEMARILDFYDVRWAYEPDTFPIKWNLEGDVVESFSPDFYLPELDLYLEMTTLRQRLVRKKNRKLRRLRELYPDIRIKLFYARDFRALMLKYGRPALAQSLSGTLGHLVGGRIIEPVGADLVDVVGELEPDAADLAVAPAIATDEPLRSLAVAAPLPRSERRRARRTRAAPRGTER